MMPIEPSADIRQYANSTRQMFVAFIEQGFTEHQALVLVCQVLASASPGGTS